MEVGLRSQIGEETVTQDQIMWFPPIVMTVGTEGQRPKLWEAEQTCKQVRLEQSKTRK